MATKTYLNAESILDNSIHSDKLVSESFKTVNGKSVIGEGEIVIDSNVQAIEKEGVLDDINTNKPIIFVTDDTLTLKSNTYYKKSTISSLLTILLEDTYGDGYVSNYCIEFTTADNGTSVTLPSSIKWLNGNTPVFENNCIYQISIVNNLGVYAKFA